MRDPPMDGLNEMKLSDEEYDIVFATMFQLCHVCNMPNTRSRSKLLTHASLFLPLTPILCTDLSLYPRMRVNDYWRLIDTMAKQNGKLFVPAKKAIHLGELESHNHYFKLALLFLMLFNNIDR
jgi:hypothetical protein